MRNPSGSQEVAAAQLVWDASPTDSVRCLGSAVLHEVEAR